MRYIYAQSFPVIHEGAALSEHGTQVGSIIVGKTLGLACKAQLVVVRNNNRSPSNENMHIHERHLASLVAILDEVVPMSAEQRAKVVINMSFGWEQDGEAFIPSAHFAIYCSPIPTGTPPDFWDPEDPAHPPQTSDAPGSDPTAPSSTMTTTTTTTTTSTSKDPPADDPTPPRVGEFGVIYPKNGGQVQCSKDIDATDLRVCYNEVMNHIKAQATRFAFRRASS